MTDLIRADARRIPLADGSVHCVVTSPPYFGLRDYQTGRWEGGDPGCDHGAAYVAGQQAGRQVGIEGGTPGSLRDKPRMTCRCGARRVDPQIGLESTPDEYVAALVAVFGEVCRVLRDDGILWLNLGDSYAREGGSTGGGNRKLLHLEGIQTRMVRLPADGSLKSKDLIGIPWQVAFALRADGWYLRADIIWSKPNPMPESVTDRPTKSHEYVFLLSKRPNYYYDADAIRERAAQAKVAAYRGKRRCDDPARYGLTRGTGNPSCTHPLGRNRRTVWTVATEPFPGAHFATFPRALVRPCILAGCPPGGLVMDPFVGSGTVGVVALAHGRRFVGLDIKPDYLALARRRIERPHAPISRRAAAMPLFAGLEPHP